MVVVMPSPKHSPCSASNFKPLVSRRHPFSAATSTTPENADGTLQVCKTLLMTACLRQQMFQVVELDGMVPKL